MVDVKKVEQAVKLILEAVGENPNRQGLLGTPKRVARYWREFIDYDAGNTDTVFDSVTSDQMVVVSGMRVWSLCEHHLLPFWCDISIGYIAADKVIGLSKLARIAHKYAHRLQLQERIVEQIANEVQRVTGSVSVAVVANGEHSCMVSRGIKTCGTMHSSEMRGMFREQHETRSEFFQLIQIAP